MIRRSPLSFVCKFDENLLSNGISVKIERDLFDNPPPTAMCLLNLTVEDQANDTITNFH